MKSLFPILRKWFRSNSQDAAVEIERAKIQEIERLLQVIRNENEQAQTNAMESSKELRLAQEALRELEEKMSYLQKTNVKLTEKRRQLQGKIDELQETLRLRERMNDTLIAEAVTLMDEYDQLLPRLDGSLRELASNVIDRLQISLERAGLDRIENETVYDVLRHQTVPMRLTANGAPIQQTLEPGLAHGQKVLRRAKVEVSNAEQ